MRHSSRTHRPSDRSSSPAAPGNRQAPLGEDRFKQLIQGASVFFAAAERDTEAEKAAAVAEIVRLMGEYGLTAADLVD